MKILGKVSLLIGLLLILSACQTTIENITTSIGQEPVRVNPVDVQTNFINQQAITPQAVEFNSDNLFSNSGFENGLDGWTACSTGAIKLSGNSFEGSNALEVVPNNCFYRSAEVSPNQDVVLSCYVKVTSGSAWTGMGMGFADSNWSTVGEAPTTVISGTSYARYDVKATIPANTKYASMWLYSENPAVVDNCTLMLESEPPTPPTPSGSNLLENGDFETLDTVNNPTEWSQDCGGSWNVSSEYSNELSLTGGVCVDQGLSAGDVATLSGKDYTYSCYATNNGGYASLSIFFDDVSFSKEIPVGQYQLIELKGTAPQASSGFVSIYSEADLIVDDCSLTVEDAQPSVCVDPVNIPDINLRNLFDIVTCAGLLNQTSIRNTPAPSGGVDISQRITSLEGIQYASNLALASIGQNGQQFPSDITPLSALVKLETLVLTGNNISDIAALSTLKELRTLGLGNNQITNIEPLSELINLEILELGNNPNLRDISALENLTNLKRVSVNQSSVTDITPLANNLGLDEGDIVIIPFEYDLSSSEVQTLIDRGVIVLQ